MADDQYSNKGSNLVKHSDENVINVPKICLLPQSSFSEKDLCGIDNPHDPSFGYSYRDSGTFDCLAIDSKKSLSGQIKAVHNWFKHLPGSDQIGLLSTLMPSVHFDYMNLAASVATTQARFIREEVYDYEKLEEDANNLESLSNLADDEPSLAINLLSRLPLLLAVHAELGEPNCPSRSASLCVHKMYAKLLTQVFSHEIADDEKATVRQLAGLTVHHPNLHAQLQFKLTELINERDLLEEREALHHRGFSHGAPNTVGHSGSLKPRPRRPGALSGFCGPHGGGLSQTHSFALLAPPFLTTGGGSNCLSASASPQSACSYNSSSGFMSGAESYGRRTQPPLSPQSSTASSCAGDDSALAAIEDDEQLSTGVSGNGDRKLTLLPTPPQPPNHDSNGSGSSSSGNRTASIHTQSSMDTPTPSSASSVLLVSAKPSSGPQAAASSSSSGGSSGQPASISPVPPPPLLGSVPTSTTSSRDEEVDSEPGSIGCYRDITEDSDRNSFRDKGSGMASVPAWLKSLRLHKYASLFQTLDYDEMLAITDEWLESKNVTKGARNKIMVNLQRLESRQSCLRQLEMDLATAGGGSSSCGALRALLTEVRHVLATPIRPVLHTVCSESGGGSCSGTGSYDPPVGLGDVAPDDLAGQIMRCLGRACSQLLTQPGGPHRADTDEMVGQYIAALDYILEHGSFSSRQKGLCRSWRLQLEMASCGQARSSAAQWSARGGASSRNWPRCKPSTRVPRPPTPLQLPHFYPQQQQQFVPAPVERTVSAPTKGALMDLFLHQYHPHQHHQQQQQQHHQQYGAACCLWPHPSDPSQSDAAASTDEDQPPPQTSPAPPSDASPNGSQDPATAEINRNLDMLAREVTELAIRDPDSPEG